MDELVDILDEHGNPTGRTCLKSEAHRNGLLHPTIHVWFYTVNGQILFQKRAANKDTFPSLWDVSVAGHIGAGEDILEAAMREVLEEIGLALALTDLEKIGIFKSLHRHSEALIDHELHHTFLSELKVPMSQLTKQASEVEALDTVAITEFESRLNRGQLDGFVPHDTAYYQSVIEEISKRL
ncbi:NUDIX hydrolase [Flagellimonas myxillae]|uniref:NUDIX hydrolase n=1 Tax=Flagellimonas myxillae TaxID=2942214 RepID=UPI00201F13AD|nr:NUDIX domain-containing protein [Muricauda myxillae]MCL6265622.1 NUDIX domain-containing protein [Muricauda myxillae]